MADYKNTLKLPDALIATYAALLFESTFDEQIRF
jgi:hypothetical protein